MEFPGIFAEDKKQIQKLFKTGDVNTLCDLAKNKHTPKSILKKLSKHENEDVRLISLSNESMPKKIILKALSSQDMKIEEAVLDQYILDIHKDVLKVILRSKNKSTVKTCKVRVKQETNYRNAIKEITPILKKYGAAGKEIIDQIGFTG